MASKVILRKGTDVRKAPFFLDRIEMQILVDLSSAGLRVKQKKQKGRKKEEKEKQQEGSQSYETSSTPAP